MLSCNNSSLCTGTSIHNSYKIAKSPYPSRTAITYILRLYITKDKKKALNLKMEMGL